MSRDKKKMKYKYYNYYMYQNLFEKDRILLLEVPSTLLKITKCENESK